MLEKMVPTAEHHVAEMHRLEAEEQKFRQMEDAARKQANAACMARIRHSSAAYDLVKRMTDGVEKVVTGKPKRPERSPKRAVEPRAAQREPVGWAVLAAVVAASTVCFAYAVY